MSVTVYGSSDDLIEIEGDIDEEFNVREADGPNYLAFSNGALLRVSYDGEWRIVVPFAGSGGVSVRPPKGEEYSDTATVAGDIKWVVCGKLALS